MTTTQSITNRVSALLEQMTLDEKLAQLRAYWMFDLQTQGELDFQKVAVCFKDGIGQITRVAGASMLDPLAAARAANSLQRFLVEHTRLGIPAIVHEECCSGAMVLGGTTFPQMIGLAGSFQPQLAEQMADVIRRQLRAIGAQQGLAPVLDVSRDPRWGRVEETFGEDPTLVSHFGVAYIRGFREFHGLAISTDSRALIPRPETELLVDAAVTDVIARLAAAPRPAGAPALRIADVGTGSGAIAIAVLASLRARRMAEHVMVVATDLSADALDLARENAVGHGLADRMVFVEADLLPPVVEPTYTVVCANLPYVGTAQIDLLARDLSFEPRTALDGGPDGLDIVRRLLDRLPDALAGDGVAYLEIGADQGETVVAAVAQHLPGWRVTVQSDLAGLPRLARVERGSPGGGSGGGPGGGETSAADRS